MAHLHDIRLGTAAWSIPRAIASRFGPGESGLARYASVFSAVEINSSFYRPHQPATYRRWADSTPPQFRFCVKIPKAISHDLRLMDCQHLLEPFLYASAQLGEKLGCLLLQLPPSFVFNASVEPFLVQVRKQYHRGLAIEPRHPSWWDQSAQRAIILNRACLVAADPTPPGVPVTGPLLTTSFQYLRLHGSPKIYWSNYPAEFLADLAAKLSYLPGPVWCFFDNTAAGAATSNALTMKILLEKRK